MFETRRFSPVKLIPLHAPEKAIELPVNLQPSTVYPRGTVLGQVTASANATHTLTTTGTPTGGDQTLQFVDPLTGVTSTFVVTFNSTAAAAQIVARAAIGNSDVAVTGGAQPGTALVFTYTGRYAAIPVPALTISATALTGGTTPAGAITSTAGVTAATYGPYTDAGSGGLDTARCILAYDCATDSAGKITLGTVAGVSQHSVTYDDTPAYFVGIFKTTDLTGLTAAAVADLGRLFSGTFTTGVLSMS